MLHAAGQVGGRVGGPGGRVGERPVAPVGEPLSDRVRVGAVDRAPAQEHLAVAGRRRGEPGGGHKSANQIVSFSKRSPFSIDLRLYQKLISKAILKAVNRVGSVLAIIGICLKSTIFITKSDCILRAIRNAVPRQRYRAIIHIGYFRRRLLLHRQTKVIGNGSCVSNTEVI